MSDTLALEFAYQAVVAQFTADGVVCAQPFGWAKSGAHLTGPRIVWVPGDPTGAAGTITGAMNVGSIPKPLFTFNEAFYVIISGYGDEATPTDELKAWKITRLLHDQWMRAMELNLKGMYKLVRQDWVRAGERDYVRFGTALIVVASIQSAVLDTTATGPITEVYPGAEILVHELDYTETVIVPPHPPPPPEPTPTP